AIEPTPPPTVQQSTPIRCDWHSMQRRGQPIHSHSNNGAGRRHELGAFEMTLALGGIHHLPAVTADAPRNLKFYTQTLGMRLIKKTVNQDDTTAYHLFYGDGVAPPGADLTFFDFPAAREQRGNHTVGRTGLRVDSEETLKWWKDHLQSNGVGTSAIKERNG